jgi:Raf kinase inhibitor-like YbhB/YbcL family protein
MVRRRLSLLVAGAALAAATPACSSDDGRALPPPDSGLVTTESSTPAIQPPTGEIAPFALQSTAFPDGEAIPERVTCRADGVSPDLSWTGTPTDALELALVVRDRDASGFVHWTVTGIDSFVLGFGESGLPEGAVEHGNDAGTVGWVPPCPPAGTGTHTYEFAIHALPAITAIPPDATAAETAALIEASSSERAVLTGTVEENP